MAAVVAGKVRRQRRAEENALKVLLRIEVFKFIQTKFVQDILITSKQKQHNLRISDVTLCYDFLRDDFHRNTRLCALIFNKMQSAGISA